MFTNSKNRIFGLDLVRAIAILLVLFSHSSILLFPGKHHLSITIIRFFGTIGVDVFFVLSGFLIGSLLLKEIVKENFSFKALLYFWVRRWFRTLPNYFLVLILNIVLFYIFYNKVIPNIGLFFVFLQNFSWPHPDFFTESWILSIEEYAYIIGPFLMFIACAIFNKTSRRSVFFIITCIIIVAISLCRYKFHTSIASEINQDWSKQLRKVVIYRLDSVYYGFIGAYLANRFNYYWKKYKMYAFSFGLILFFGVHIVIFADSLQPETTSLFFNIFYLPLISVSILLFFPYLSQLDSAVFFNTQITNIILWSYSLYLINYSIVLLSIQYFVDVDGQSYFVKALLLVVYWLFSFFFSFILYNFFEKPTTELRNKPFIKSFF